MTSNPPRRAPALPQGRAPLLAVLPAIVLGFFVITAHAQHVMPSVADHSHAQSAKVPHTIPAAYQEDTGADLTPGVAWPDCPLPGFLAPQVAGLASPGTVTSWTIPVLVPIGGGLPHRTAGIDRPPRPPGPTRQALLQCFRL